MIFPSVEVVEGIHSDLIEEFGGSHGLRDRGLLESAVARAANKAFYDPDASTAEVAASLARGLIKNHAFIDGNKRVGMGAMLAFLTANNHRNRQLRRGKSGHDSASLGRRNHGRAMDGMGDAFSCAEQLATFYRSSGA